MRVSACKYEIKPELHTFVPEGNPYMFRRYGCNNLYHWLTGKWLVTATVRPDRYSQKYAWQFACGKLYGPYTPTYMAYSMHDLKQFCPKCLSLYHKRRFTNGE